MDFLDGCPVFIDGEVLGVPMPAAGVGVVLKEPGRQPAVNPKPEEHLVAVCEVVRNFQIGSLLPYSTSCPDRDILNFPGFVRSLTDSRNYINVG